MKILVLFYSMYGHIYSMAKAIADGAKSVTGSQVEIRRVPEILSEDVLSKMGAVEAQKVFADIPEISPDELANYDAIIFGAPTRYGNVPVSMQSFFDQTGNIWSKGALVGKVGGAFTSSATQHGGQESTLLGMHKFLLHQGMIVAGLPYAFQGQMTLDEITGCSPYGASTIAGGDGSRLPSKNELDGAKFQGKFIAELASKISK